MMFVKAFVIGGLICVIGQVLLAKTKLTFARILVIYVVAGVILSALGLYQPLVDFAGAAAYRLWPFAGHRHQQNDFGKRLCRRFGGRGHSHGRRHCGRCVFRLPKRLDLQPQNQKITGQSALRCIPERCRGGLFAWPPSRKGAKTAAVFSAQSAAQGAKRKDAA